MELKRQSEYNGNDLVYILKEALELSSLPLSEKEKKYAQKRLEDKSELISINRMDGWIFLVAPKRDKGDEAFYEQCRKKGNEIATLASGEKLEELGISGTEAQAVLAVAEGVALSSYRFLNHFTDKKGKETSLQSLSLISENLKDTDVSELANLVKSVYKTRDLVNEPLSHMNAERLAASFQEIGKEAGITVDVLHKQKIESLKMGGLLAVNKGSIDPPTFTIMEWKPENPVNEKPIVLVGKGVVYDTGGMSLKPTPNSMDYMKSDMAGGAAVGGAIYAAALNRLPLHIIALVPATDNRPDGNAYVPGDVITMYSGKTVEVLNTDAEGRLLLADALSYAKKFEPELVIDAATLTGAAAVALGQYGVAGMGTAKPEVFQKLQKAGNEVYERVVEFPFWDEYGELLKSDIADLKNLGPREAGMITAGKFLENFVDYPWIHLDIAGAAFLMQPDSYRGRGATGSGVRLLYRFLKSMVD
jgi:leucyl aminopeptidase